ncbi:hypothetical protein [Mesorhizobium sp.]|uniref:hypothetical protein n=1 Tax=Mesorhizobium sp. TaxID=1871066 RepID=UPI0025FB22A2|nr:hypothetical protein [Mesorhizobium sp.]
MTISKDLFLSILSMDAYNREYNAGIAVTGDLIGTATVRDHEQIGISPTEYDAWQ